MYFSTRLMSLSEQLVMMPINKDSLSGYVLEEILAFLIKNTGYRIITAKGTDPQLEQIGAGLAVKGRGGTHQVDVLGELEWMPAFTFPIRLFVEAKFRKAKTRLPTVRNALATILDVNQANEPRRNESSPPLQKYHYVYSLFSTSGFSEDAQDMAWAYQISLVDLSGLEYQQLLESIKVSVNEIAADLGGTRFVSNLRHAIRRNLGTLVEVDSSLEDFNEDLIRVLERGLTPALQEARRYEELFVGVANGPYLLLLKARDPNEFLRYAKTNPRHDVAITWGSHVDQGGTWIIRPSASRGAYELRFRLPRVIYEWIFKARGGTRKRAFQAKEQYFQNITVFYRDSEGDYLFRLEFDPLASITDAESHAYA